MKTPYFPRCRPLYVCQQPLFCTLFSIVSHFRVLCTGLADWVFKYPNTGGLRRERRDFKPAPIAVYTLCPSRPLCSTLPSLDALC